MRLEKLIWKEVNNFANIKHIDANDLFQDCYEHAIKAVKHYDEKKEASLSTFVCVCVKNHLKDIHKSESFRETEEMLECDEPTYEVDDFMLTMKKILNKKNFDIFVLHFVESYTYRQIAEIKQIPLHEVQKCLQAICHLYQSNVLNPIQAMTS